MIRIEVPRDLIGKIDEFKEGWSARANERAAGFIERGKYEESSSIWSEIKPVYMRLQFNKCAYCERVLAGELAGKGEHDLEHYRPKSKAKIWPSKSMIRDRKLDYSDIEIKAPFDGYYWLAYDPENYVTACKACNSALKSNYFPIAGSKGVRESTIRALNDREKPFLVYPLGKSDIDPREIITFYGAIAVPKKRLRATNKKRARINIDFFRLNEREELLSERFRGIREYWAQFERRENSPNEASRQDATLAMDELTSSYSPHASCLTAFAELCESNIAEAYTLYQLAREYSRGSRTS